MAHVPIAKLVERARLAPHVVCRLDLSHRPAHFRLCLGVWNWAAAHKIEIVLAGMRGDRTINEVCRDHELAATI
jgi:hypothetical protein